MDPEPFNAKKKKKTKGLIEKKQKNALFEKHRGG